MLLPYNVDRPARRLPVVTYSLMGINIVVFLITIAISNISLPADRIAGQSAVREVLTENRAKLPDDQRAMVDELLKSDPKKDGDKSSGEGMYAGLRGPTREELLGLMALKILSDDPNKDTKDLERFYLIAHSQDRFVEEPHYSVVNLFAYRPAEPSFWGKILGVFGSMFLHGGFDHLLGNMLFLWVFGRAVEDALGRGIYIGSYVLSGVAAVLLNHIITTQFAASSTPISYYLGASGAIAGVLGTFALRFYRTPVRVFALLPWTGLVAAVGVGILVALIYPIVQDPSISLVFAVVGVLAFLITKGRDWAWRNFAAPSAWAIGIYVALFDLLPAVRSLTNTQSGDGTAHWAHIGGFAFGMLYAALIGGKQEGAAEYQLEDAQKAASGGDAAGAMTSAEAILEREPENAEARFVLAQAHDKQNNEEEALDAYESAIAGFLREGARDKAAGAYLSALQKYPSFIMPSGAQSQIGAQLARQADYQNAAETLVKIPYTFPDSPESEVALLRSAQLYLEQLNQPDMAMQLLTEFFQRYPQTEWLPQAQRAWRIAQHQLNPQDGEAEAV